MSAVPLIRVAVLTRGDSLESWEVDAIRAVRELPFVEIVMEIVDGTPTEKKSFVSRVANYKWKRLFWNRWFRKYGKVNATEVIETASVFHAVPRFPMIPDLKGKYSQYFSTDDIAKIKAYAPDVILRFGFNILRGEILTVAKYGVWSFHHADHEKIRGGPAGFWEYILGHTVTGAILQRLNEKLDDGIVLRCGYWPLVKHSFRENLDTLLKSTSPWIANALTEIHLHGKVETRHIGKDSSSKAPVYYYPGNFRMIQFWFKLLGNKLSFHWNNLFCPETWRIGIVDQSMTDVIENGIRSTPKWIAAEKKSDYLADPFSVSLNGKSVILAEHYSYGELKGKIVNVETKESVLSGEHHFSFPFPVNVDEEICLLPECSEVKHCSLYRMKSNEPFVTLVHEPLVDPVLFQHNGKWWLFANHLNMENNSALFIYYSDDIRGEFKPHRLNPVKTDIRNSRSAGPIINANGKLLRPAQDSSGTYGGAIVINEITELTTDSFREHEFKRINPQSDWAYNEGIHTLSPYGHERTLIDAKSFRFNFANFRAQLKRKSRRIAGK